MSKSPPYPFLKWAGGKARMADAVCRRLPRKIRTYYEPMIGGGAVFIRLAKESRFERAIIGDVNEELVTTWKVVRDDVSGLMAELQDSGDYVYRKDAYLAVRDRARADMTDVQTAARFIYLNKTCFNGLYRVNRLGEFNVPFGRYKDPVICDSANLLAVSKLLKGVRIEVKDFDKCIEKAEPRDAVYLDPPYVPVSETSSFTGYTAGGFDEDDHRRMARAFGRLSKRGVRIVLSNSVAPLCKELYGGYDYDLVTGSRSIGGPASYRGTAGEMVVFAGPLGPSDVCPSDAYSEP